MGSLSIAPLVNVTTPSQPEVRNNALSLVCPPPPRHPLRYRTSLHSAYSPIIPGMGARIGNKKHVAQSVARRGIHSRPPVLQDNAQVAPRVAKRKADLFVVLGPRPGALLVVGFRKHCHGCDVPKRNDVLRKSQLAKPEQIVVKRCEVRRRRVLRVYGGDPKTGNMILPTVFLI